LPILLSAAQTLSGVISGAGNVSKDTSSASTLTLTGANTYSGTTTVSAGTLAFTSSQPNTSGINIGAAGTLSLSNNAAVGSPISGATVINGTVSGNGTVYGYASSATAMTLAGTVALNASGGTLTLSANGANIGGKAMDMSGSISTTGSVAFNLNASGSIGGRRIIILSDNTTVNATSGSLTVTGIQTGADVGLKGARTF